MTETHSGYFGRRLAMLSSDTISNTNTIGCLHPGHRTMELATIGFIVACFITSASSQCPTGSDMVTQPDGSPLACSSNTSCPNPYFCASGVCCINCPANQEWNNCGSACNRTCEAPNPKCILPCAPGCHCPANAPIWRSDQCISQDECKCPSGHPLLGPTGAELTCRTQPCPKGSFCKTHPADAYTVCCPNVTMKCPNGAPLVDSTGMDLFCGRGLGSQRCPPGTYCNIAPDDSFAVCCPDACPAGAPVLDDNGSIRYCNLRSCPKGSFCHPHHSIPNAVCCPVCSLEKDAGPCRGALPRWYFDSVAQMCMPFTYGGCLGNANNFVTEKECRDACHQCPTRPVNGTTCPPIKCLPPASHEVYVFDINGCPTCDLVDPLPCKNYKCRRCQSCRMVQVQCVRAPCPPKAMCIDDPCSKKQPCSKKCDAYDKDQFGCRRCSCNDVCEDVRCMTKKERCMVMDGFAVCKQRATASSNIVLYSDLTTCVLLFFWYLTA